MSLHLLYIQGYIVEYENSSGGEVEIFSSAYVISNLSGGNKFLNNLSGDFLRPIFSDAISTLNSNYFWNCEANK